MYDFVFSVDTPFSYCWCGKFEAPGNDWTQPVRPLMDYEIFVVTEGTLYIADSERKYIVNKEEYLIMPPTEKQYGYTPSYCSYFWMHFNPSPYDKDAKNIIELPENRVVPNIERIIILFNQLRDTDRRYHHKYTNDMLLTVFFLELYSQVREQKGSTVLSSRTQLYQSVLDFIDYNKFRRISVTEISKHFGYHEKYLSAVFKDMAGITLKQYLLQVIMEQAKSELMDTNKTIAQIAYSIGYSDNHNFTNAFKKVTGITPSEYKASCTKLPKVFEVG